VLGLGKKRNKRKKQNDCNIPSPPTMTLPQANKYANPQPVRPAGKLQGNVKPLGIPAEIPNSKKKSKKLKKV